MRDLDSDGVKETKVNSSAVVAAPNPTTADNGVPNDANVTASYLYWGTWYMSDNFASENGISTSNYAQRCHTLSTDTCSALFGGAVLKYSSSWSSMTSGTSSPLYGVWGSSSNNVYAVGNRNHPQIQRHFLELYDQRHNCHSLWYVGQRE